MKRGLLLIFLILLALPAVDAQRNIDSSQIADLLEEQGDESSDICAAGETRDCGLNTGVCQAGVQTCGEDNTWSICFGASYPTSLIEDCDGLDNDCDGQVDEGCGCIEGAIQQCGSSIGACKIGGQTCKNGKWTSCLGVIAPVSEVCGDLTDNDCDGFIDYDDDNCMMPSEPEPQLEPEEEEIVQEDVECFTNRDCELGFECIENECLPKPPEPEEEEDQFASPITQFEELEGPNLFGILAPVILVFLILLLVIMFVLQRKKKKKKLKKTSTQAPVQSKSYQLPFQKTATKRRKSPIEKKLEKSLEESKRLFKR